VLPALVYANLCTIGTSRTRPHCLRTRRLTQCKGGSGGTSGHRVGCGAGVGRVAGAGRAGWRWPGRRHVRCRRDGSCRNSRFPSRPSGRGRRCTPGEVRDGRSSGRPDRSDRRACRRPVRPIPRTLPRLPSPRLGRLSDLPSPSDVDQQAPPLIVPGRTGDLAIAASEDAVLDES